MFDTATYRPNRLVTDGSAWMRAQGIDNHRFSHDVVGDHVHMLNCMFDQVILFAVVETHTSGYGKVTKTGTCHICTPPKPEPEPVRYQLDYDTDHGHFSKHVTAEFITNSIGPVLSRQAGLGNAWNIAVYDPATGGDITFDFDCFTA